MLLPPTRSIAMAKNRLERVPCSDDLPLAQALNMAATLGTLITPPISSAE